MLFPIDQQQAQADKTAFEICETGERVSYAQLEARANQVAQLHFQLSERSIPVLKNRPAV